MMYSLILDVDNKGVAIYKDLELYRFIPIDIYENLSYDQLIDIGCEHLKRVWRKSL